MTRGIRAVAVFEALKGVLVLGAGVGLFSLLPKDLAEISEVGESIVRHLHLNPAHHYPHVFLVALSDLTDKNIFWLAIGAMAYSLLRLTEAYGLWYERVWAEWLAIVSGGLYLPVEIYELSLGATFVKAFVTVLNLILVIYLLKTRLQTRPGFR